MPANKSTPLCAYFSANRQGKGPQYFWGDKMLQNWSSLWPWSLQNPGSMLCQEDRMQYSQKKSRKAAAFKSISYLKTYRDTVARERRVFFSRSRPLSFMMHQQRLIMSDSRPPWSRCLWMKLCFYWKTGTRLQLKPQLAPKINLIKLSNWRSSKIHFEINQTTPSLNKGRAG